MDGQIDLEIIESWCETTLMTIVSLGSYKHIRHVVCNVERVTALCRHCRSWFRYYL